MTQKPMSLPFLSISKMLSTRYDKDMPSQGLKVINSSKPKMKLSSKG
jgi:hypothetical protein